MIIKLFLIVLAILCVVVDAPGIVRFQKVIPSIVTLEAAGIEKVVATGFIVPAVTIRLLFAAPHVISDVSVTVAPLLLFIVTLF